jgi:pyridoxine/pyridoxamine 5'-phosphate oxidase
MICVHNARLFNRASKRRGARSTPLQRINNHERSNWMSKMPGVDLVAVGRTLLDQNRYLTLASADANGRPWANPVWYAHRGYRAFLWVSRPHARHSVNLRRRPEVALVIFDSSLPPEQRQAVYIDAVAREVHADEISSALDTFNARSVASGLAAWTSEDVANEYRLYIAIAQKHWLLREDRDERVPVDLAADPSRSSR